MLLVKPFSLQSLKPDYRHQFRVERSNRWQALSLDEQLARSVVELEAQPSLLAKNQYLHQLLDNNELLFYKLVKKHWKEILPLLYTPTVGEVIRTFSQTRPSTHGLYISWEDRDRIETLLAPYSESAIRIAILTDGERILGLGDQGVGGIEICIAKAMMYVLCGLIAPYRLLPIYLDIGTNNTTLMNDPDYKGWRHPRLGEKDYDHFIERVVTALHHKFPGIYLHWEDLARDHAKRILEHYSHQYCSFNDDVQGTGVVTLAGALSAVKITQIPLIQQRIVIVGGGAAGIGVADQLCQAMQRMGLSQTKAQERIWLIGRYGLLFSDSLSLIDSQAPYARPSEERPLYKKMSASEEVDLYSVVRCVSPTFLIGCSGKRGIFTEAIIKTMANQVERPIIFPLSNPTQCCEAMPGDILRWTEGSALVATGSPFSDEIINGERFTIAQCNNALAFPGIGLGIQASGAPLLTDEMLWEASLALFRATPSSCEQPRLLPSMLDIHRVTQQIARGVYQAFQKASGKTESDEIIKHLQAQYWRPLME